MNWISITLNVLGTHKHTHTYCFCERWGFRSQRNSHLTSLTHTKTPPKFLTVTCSRPTFLEIARQMGGLCQRRREREESMRRRKRRGEEKRWREEEGERGQAGESQQAVVVEVIMRHWSEPRRWHDEIHELCLCSSVSHCLFFFLPVFLWLFLLIAVLFCLIPFYHISGFSCFCFIFFLSFFPPLF